MFRGHRIQHITIMPRFHDQGRCVCEMFPNVIRDQRQESQKYSLLGDVLHGYTDLMWKIHWIYAFYLTSLGLSFWAQLSQMRWQWILKSRAGDNILKLLYGSKYCLANKIQNLMDPRLSDPVCFSHDICYSKPALLSIDREAREIMHLVESVRPSVRPSICLFALSCLNRLTWRAAVDIRGPALQSAEKGNRSHYQL